MNKMALTSILTHAPAPAPPPKSFSPRPLSYTCSALPLPHHSIVFSASHFFRTSLLRIRAFEGKGADGFDGENSGAAANEMFRNQRNNSTSSSSGNSFLVILAIAAGIAAIVTVASLGLKNQSSVAAGSFFGVQCLPETSYSVMASAPLGFSFKAFGYRIILPEYAPGWIYFWLLMAAGCGLFISEEALNVWVCP